MDILDITPEQLNPTKLGFISFGSIGGISIGLLLSFIIVSPLSKLIVAVFLFGLSLYMILKNIKLLM